jgi:predicted phosphodiesterase
MQFPLTKSISSIKGTPNHILEGRMRFTIFFLSWLFVLAAQAKKTEIIAFGDAPYYIPEGYQMFETLIDQVNKENPDFAIHVGDILGTECTDEVILKVRNYFKTFKVPMFYTPGDNEWTDCHRRHMGGYDPLERLNFLRKEFFAEINFGPDMANITRQHSRIENAQWTKNDVQFFTVHIVGSNNNKDRDEQEYTTRLNDTLTWLETNFRLAKERNAKAIVMMFHANIFLQKEKVQKDKDGKDIVVKKYHSGFKKILKKLQELVPKSELPVLAIHGDSHKFRFDTPLMVMTPYEFEYNYHNFYRLEVFGYPEIRNVKITIDTEKDVPFSVELLKNIPWTYPKD